MHIGLFGGAFNPPHVGHLIVAETARAYAGLDQVLWIPTGRPPHKTAAPFAPPADRLEMVTRAIHGHPSFAVSDVELTRPGPSYMVETVSILSEEHPHDTLSLVIGGDSLAAFHTWFRFEEILRSVDLIVFDRPGMDYSEVGAEILKAVKWVPAPPLVGISSSDIRQRVASGVSIRYLVPESVEHYIRRRNLYSA